MVVAGLEVAFKNALARVPAAVAVVTVGSQNLKRGVTCSSFSHVSVDPPIISFGLSRESRLHQLLTRSDLFAVHILSKHQVVQSIHFSKPADNAQDQFGSIPHTVGKKGVPIIKDTLAVFLCSPLETKLVGDHHLWLGKVTEVISDGTGGEPLLYYGRRYKTVGDDSFMSAFEHSTLPFNEWTHTAHVRMAWNYLGTYGSELATPLIKNGIKSFNESNKEKIKHGYHETITQFYIDMVGSALKRSSVDAALQFDVFLKENQHLTRSNLALDFYSEKVLYSQEAKMRHVAPDKKPLPL